MRRLARCERGAVALLVAVAVVPLLLAIGLGVDLARIYLVRTRLSYAIDAAGLAAGAASGDDAALEVVARRFFDANYPAAAVDGVVTTFRLATAGDVITVRAAARVPTTLMALGGSGSVDVAAVAEVTRQVRGLELAMVLDNTGSMLTDDNIGALREAAQTMVDILFGAETVHPYLKIGLVPYSAAVNPGAASSALVAAGAAYAPTSLTGWKGCVIERAAPNTLADIPASTARWTRYVWAAGKKDNDYDPSRPSTIHAAPSYGNASTGPNVGCPTAITPLTNVKATLTGAVTAMEAWSRGGTLGDIGMAWGLRVLSPEPPFTEGLAWGTPEWTKAAILMTDGNNQIYKLTGTAGPNEADNSVKSDYTGYDRLDLLGRVGTTSIATAKTIVDARLAQVCAAMKAKGIRVYAVTFTPGIDAATKALYAGCASDADAYFDSPSQSDLKAAFRAIANELSNLRISR